MKKYILVSSAIIGLTLIINTSGHAQASTKDDVRLFQSFFQDSPISTTPYGEGVLNYFDFEGGSTFDLGAQGGMAVTPEVELGAGLYYHSINPDGDADGESGIRDIPVYGRYNFVAKQQTKVSGGAYVTLPVGSEDIGQGNTNLGFFGALRHAVSNQVVLTGTLGINFLEGADDDREMSLALGGGAIYAAMDELNIIGELSIETEVDYSALSGGVDYELSDAGRIRGALLLGLDDGAPDLGLIGGFLFTF